MEARNLGMGLHQLAASAPSAPSPRGCGTFPGSLGLLANRRGAFSRLSRVWALCRRIFKSRQIPVAAARPLLLPAPFRRFPSSGPGLADRGLFLGYVPGPISQYWDRSTWDLPTEVDLVPGPHLHPRYEAGGSGRSRALASCPVRGGGGQSWGRGGETLDSAPEGRWRLACALLSGPGSQKFASPGLFASKLGIGWA